MHKPPDAHKAYSGVAFDIYTWDQELFDGSTATYENVVRKDSVQVIAIDGDDVLIANEEQSGRGSFKGLFGGVIEDGEEPLVAAKREFLEETGMEAQSWELLGVHDQKGRLSWNTYVYIAKGLSKIQEQNFDPGERITIERVSKSAFLDLCVQKDFRASFVFQRMFPVVLQDPSKLSQHL